MKNKKIVVVAILTILVAILAGAFFLYRVYPKTLEESLPARMANIPLAQTISGEKAMEMTKRSHRGVIAGVTDMAVGYYARDLSVWLSRYPDKEAAKSETLRMARAMPRFGRGFENLSRLKLGGETAYRTMPGGKPQYFWVKNNVMVYIIPDDLSQEEVDKVARQINLKIFFYSFVP